ncbi:hypothetical protein GCM10022280_23370 [Sphingomonas swuensis]|uniref:Uncharacterized protein n=1 Tax=Sphingomonas swuensis TaxID=977800 RepID=A0ABP7T755_9SPHN
MTQPVSLLKSEQVRRQTMLLRLQLAMDDPRLTPELRARVELGARRLRALLRREHAASFPA